MEKNLRLKLDVSRCNCCLQTTELCCSRWANARQIFSASYYIILHTLHTLNSADLFQQYEKQLVTATRTLSYVPQCSGNEQTVSTCTSTQPTVPCSLIALVRCSNATTSTTSQTVANYPMPSSSSSSSSTPASPFSTYLTAQATLTLSKTQSTPNSTAPPLPLVTPQSTSDPVPIAHVQPSSSSQLLSTATTSHYSPPPSPSLSPLHTNKTTYKETIPPFLFYTVIGSGVLVLLAVAMSLLAAVLACRRCCSRGRKGPVVENHTYDLPSNSRNRTYLEVENKKSPLPQTEGLYADLATPGTKHTLKHSPETPTRKSMLDAHGGKVVPNEALYEQVQLNRKEQQRSQVPQKSPFYHDPTAKPLNCNLEAGNSVEHKYNVLQAPPGPTYQVLEAPPGVQQQVQGTGGSLYSQACETRATTFPRQETRSRTTIEPVVPARGQPAEEML